MSLFGHLLRANVTLDVETPTFSVTGGTTASWNAVASSVPALITLAGGNRANQAGGDFQRDQYTVSGVDETLARTDIRLKVTACADYPDLVGGYLRVDSAVPHAKGQLGLLRKRITLRVSKIQAPGNDLT